jgi:uncharacterized protein (DUF39 family)
MNPGISEEADKVATATVGALSSTPAVLALVIFNALFMAAVVYVGINNVNHFDAEMTRMHELVATIISSCGPK